METYKSRFGYHSVDYVTFAKIKKLYKFFWRTASDLGKWKRWVRKQPENRVGPEPKFCPVFVTKPNWIVGLSPQDVQSWGWSRYKCDVAYSKGIWEAYHAARHPYGKPEDVPPCKISKAQIDSLLEEIEKYESNQ